MYCSMQTRQKGWSFSQGIWGIGFTVSKQMPHGFTVPKFRHEPQMLSQMYVVGRVVDHIHCRHTEQDNLL